MPRRHGNLFNRIVAAENIEAAYHRARKGKGRMKNVKRFAMKKDQNLEKIRKTLVEKTFTTSKYQEKTIREPKKRTIYVLPFSPDRIVQHALMAIIEPIWDNMMLSDSYACRVGKGVHRGSRRTMQFVRRYHYCLKCDVSKFYPSVDHAVLKRIIRRKIKCQNTLWLIDDIIDSFPGGKNVPIGNYTSQWFGNLYLNELDTFVKCTLKVGPYVRYCDDFCLFSDEKAQLRAAALSIENFLRDCLKLSMSKCDLFPVSHGVDFLGYRHFRRYVLLRKSTATRVMRRLSALPQRLLRRKISKESARSSLASTKGWMKWANTHNLKLALKIGEIESFLDKEECGEAILGICKRAAPDGRCKNEDR